MYQLNILIHPPALRLPLLPFIPSKNPLQHQHKHHNTKHQHPREPHRVLNDIRLPCLEHIRERLRETLDAGFRVVFLDRAGGGVEDDAVQGGVELLRRG